eukprot:scaffold385013_cov18-Prasinocladus_malaysianus.AAC.1
MAVKSMKLAGQKETLRKYQLLWLLVLLSYHICHRMTSLIESRQFVARCRLFGSCIELLNRNGVR